MQFAVRYASRGGNTKKVADAIAGAVGVAAAPVSTPLADKVDLLFLGSGIYAGGIDASLKAFIGTLAQDRVGAVAVFSTSAIKKTAYPEIRQLVEAQGIRVMESDFHCRGQFTVMHRGRPNAQDLSDAAAFARKLEK